MKESTTRANTIFSNILLLYDFEIEIHPRGHLGTILLRAAEQQCPALTQATVKQLPAEMCKVTMTCLLPLHLPKNVLGRREETFRVPFFL